MSSSTLPNRTQYVIAIAGATGNLGNDVTGVFLDSHYRSRFTVIALVRDPASSGAQALAAKGAELRQVHEADPLPSFLKALEGVDVVVNVLPGGKSWPMMDALVEAIVQRGVKVYFPTEFGADHRKDYWAWQQSEWIRKSEHDRKAREMGQGRVKVIEVYTSLFLELCFAPFLGFDHANNTYTYLGSPHQKVTFTSKTDIGRALAELSILALSPATASRVPDHVRISGSILTFTEAKDVVQRVREEFGNDHKIVLKREDLNARRQDTIEALAKDPSLSAIPLLRLAVNEGQLDFSTNDNELVNPKESLWKWKTVEDFVREMKGLA